eukprot:scaffold113750_cov26-Tisochrysis_lutea.AAC.2
MVSLLVAVRPGGGSSAASVDASTSRRLQVPAVSARSLPASESLRLSSAAAAGASGFGITGSGAPEKSQSARAAQSHCSK